MKKKEALVPNHVLDILSVFHDIVFTGSDGEEQYEQFLTLEQKELISLALSVYYQCAECSRYHSRVVCKLQDFKLETINKHIASMILYLRTDIGRISPIEYQRWIETWDQLSVKVALKFRNDVIPTLIGFAIGIAANNDNYIQLFGQKIKDKYLNETDERKVIGEVVSVVLFMKAATSKNRIMDKLEILLAS